MNAVFQQIKASYEVENKSPEFIAEDQELDVTAVKAALMQCSSKYRKDCGMEDLEHDRLNFNNSQLEDVTQELYRLGMSTEDEHLKFKCLTYIRDDKKGRKEVVKAMQNNTINILQFNESLKMARQAKKRLIEV